MEKKLLSDFTESEFLDFVTDICKASYKSDQEHLDAVFLFEQLSEHPAGSDLLYYPEPGADSTPAGVVKLVREWRAANGKPGFKS